MGDTTLGVRTESIPTPDLSQHPIVNRLGVNGHGETLLAAVGAGTAPRPAMDHSRRPQPVTFLRR